MREHSSPTQYIDSYYTRTRENTPEFTQLCETVKTPVCVIGGGMAGVATAQGLLDRGISPVLLEGRKIAWAASGRNGGFVSAGYALSPEKIFKAVGQEDARALHQLTHKALDLIEKRLGDKRKTVCAEQQGLVGISWFNDTDAVQKHISFMNDVMGECFSYWSHEKVTAHYKSDRYYDAYFKPRALQMHSLNYSCHAAQMAANDGAQIYENSPVTQLQKKGDVWHVQTPQGCVIADQIVLCCGVQTGGIQAKLARAILPVATFVMLTEPLQERLQEAVNAPYAVLDNRFSSNYYRPLPDSRLLWGGRVSMFHPSQQRLKHVMMKDLLSVYPQLKGIQAEVAWGGHMGYPVHKMPQIGRLKDGLWYAQGFGGHGMTSTVAAGEVVSSAIATGDETYKLFAPFSLRYAGKPFGPIVAQSAYWMFQVQDAMRVFMKNR